MKSTGRRLTKEEFEKGVWFSHEKDIFIDGSAVKNLVFKKLVNVEDDIITNFPHSNYLRIAFYANAGFVYSVLFFGEQIINEVNFNECLIIE